MSPELQEKMPPLLREHDCQMNELRAMGADLVELRAALRLPLAVMYCKDLDDYYRLQMSLPGISGRAREQAAAAIQRARR